MAKIFYYFIDKKAEAQRVKYFSQDHIRNSVLSESQACLPFPPLWLGDVVSPILLSCRALLPLLTYNRREGIVPVNNNWLRFK